MTIIKTTIYKCDRCLVEGSEPIRWVTVAPLFFSDADKVPTRHLCNLCHQAIFHQAPEDGRRP